MRLATVLLLLIAAPLALAQPTLLASADGDVPLVLASVADVDADDANPGSVTIYALYPNPTAERSELSFAVDQAQAVRVVLYDVLGRRVATLFEGDMDADVSRSVDIDVADLPVGLYVVRVTGDEFRAVRRLTVAR